MNQRQDILVKLLRLALNADDVQFHTFMPSSSIPSQSWNEVMMEALEQEVTAIAFDGLEHLPKAQMPPMELLMDWISKTCYQEKQYQIQFTSAAELSKIFDKNYIRTIVLKGFAVSRLYPNPEHRFSCDMDCFLLSKISDPSWDAFNLGNSLVESLGTKVNRDYYKHTEFTYKGLHVENHKYCCSVKRGKRTRDLELYLQGLLKFQDCVYLEDSKLTLPPPLFQGLFLIEHANGHFLYEKMTIKHVCDWAMFRRHYHENLDWKEFDRQCDRFGLKSFVETMNHLADYVMGYYQYSDLRPIDQRVLNDIFRQRPIDKSKQQQRIRKAFGVLRSNWKFRHFSADSMLTELSNSFFGYLKGINFEC